MSDAAIRIGTRASTLARAQTSWVAGRLRDAGLTVEVVSLSTRGDERRDLTIPQLGGDGVFVRELEQAILSGAIDAAVHSLKDMPTAMPEGLTIACVPQRVTPFDAVVSRSGQPLEALPPAAVVGTSSIRRVAQVRRLRPDLVIKPLRGNVDTRLRKLDAGDYDALVLAAAGLERLGLSDRITQLLQPPSCWPAVGQGAVAIQTRAGDSRVRGAMEPLDDASAHAAVIAERRMLAALAGGCLAPIGGWGRIGGDGRLVLGGCVLDMDAATGTVQALVVEEATSLASWRDRGAAESLGDAVAMRLLDGGGRAMLERMRIPVA